MNVNKVPCLFWTDDLLLISKSKQGLQKQIEIVDQYCSDWKLTLNVEKTKTVIFNKAGARSKKEQIQYRGKNIKTVKHFKYLGILLDSNGKFQTAINELTKKLLEPYVEYIDCRLVTLFQLKHSWTHLHLL